MVAPLPTRRAKTNRAGAPVGSCSHVAEARGSFAALPNEADADYAGRLRLAAADFIRGCDAVGDDALFALTFPMWKDAA